MCKLFAISSQDALEVNGLLREFFAYADENPHGWGFASLTPQGAEVVRSPDRADTSAAATALLARPIWVASALAHIRFATVGQVETDNCHPFSAIDASGRPWVLAHKGTIFDFEPLNRYFYTQAGSTDSERVLLYLIDEIDAAAAEKGAPLEAVERFAVFEDVCARLSPGNCVSLIAFDSDLLYLHNNYQGALNCLQGEGRAVFCTEELAAAAAVTKGAWRPLPLCTALAYRQGREVLRGVAHGAEYFQNEEDTRFLYQDYAAL